MSTTTQRALIIGSSDGIGLETARRLASQGWQVTGISRSASRVDHASYSHHVMDVSQPTYRPQLAALVRQQQGFDACIYCAGVGHEVDLHDLDGDLTVFRTNLMGALETAAVLIPQMVQANAGHFIVLSSLADALISDDAPSYCASKAGLSSYFEGLALALRKTKVRVTNIRLGFVDTKMAKAPMRPFMMARERAATVVVKALTSKRIRVSKPLLMALVVRLLRWVMDWRVRL